MFRIKKKIEQPKMYTEAEKQMIMQLARGEPQPINLPQQQIQERPSITQPTTYFISKKDFVRNKQTVVTQTGQVIEVGEEITKEVVKNIYQLTKDDLIAIIKGVDENKPIHQLALKMLLTEL